YPIDFVVKHPDISPKAHVCPQAKLKQDPNQRMIPSPAQRSISKSSLRNSPSGGSNRLGGAEEDRTPDPLLAKQVLSQLSYSPIGWNLWWAWVDSNYRPHPYQGCALTN